MSPEDDAFKAGQRSAFIDAQLNSHEERLNAINGSIERNVRGQTQLRNSIGQLSDKVDEIVASLATKAAVDAALKEQVRKANEQQISSRTFWLGVAAIIATLVAALLASHGGVFA